MASISSVASSTFSLDRSPPASKQNCCTRIWDCFSKAISKFVSWLKEICCCSSRTETSVSRAVADQSFPSRSSITNIETPTCSPSSGIVTTKTEKPDLPPTAQTSLSPSKDDDEEYIEKGADLISVPLAKEVAIRWVELQGTKVSIRWVELPTKKSRLETLLEQSNQNGQ